MSFAWCLVANNLAQAMWRLAVPAPMDFKVNFLVWDSIKLVWECYCKIQIRVSEYWSNSLCQVMQHCFNFYAIEAWQNSGCRQELQISVPPGVFDSGYGKDQETDFEVHFIVQPFCMMHLSWRARCRTVSCILKQSEKILTPCSTYSLRQEHQHVAWTSHDCMRTAREQR